ncbi:MAG: DUF5678 domain-containing protein [Candidatus Thermoplasmatota archaeon]
MAGMTAGEAASAAISKDDMRRMVRSAKNKLYALENMDTLRLRHADKYVAIDRGKVLAEGDTSDEVFANLRKAGITDISFIAVEFVFRDPVIRLS